MDFFRNTFSNARVILPVIHVRVADQVLRNARIAYEAGCDGVFLINHHGIPYTTLFDVCHVVYKKFPYWWIGINCLDLDPADVFIKVVEEFDYASQEIAGIWVDNSMIDESFEEQVEAERIQEARRESGWQGLYFGGVAFKYQRPVDDWKKAARIASEYMDVVTTSGPATGEPAEVIKIQEMKQSIGDKPLAIASGISSGNIDRYLGIADCFLIATGISKDFWQLDSDLTKKLVRKVRNYQP